MPSVVDLSEATATARAAGLAVADRQQAFRQMVLDVAAAIRDDHTENFGFLYDEGGWRLAPAFDLSFPFLEGGGWLTSHQMSIAGRVDGATRAVLRDLADRARVPNPDDVIVEVVEVVEAVGRWSAHAEQQACFPPTPPPSPPSSPGPPAP